MSEVVEPEAVATVATTTTDEIKRTSSPHTTDGKRWEVQLSATPSRQWRELFKSCSEASRVAQPRRLEFDRAGAVFACDEQHVAHWIESIDRWFASTNARHLLGLEQVRRERFDRLDAEAKEKERIQQLNDRFKDL